MLTPAMVYICTTIAKCLPLIHFVWTGCLLIAAALLAAAFSTSIITLILTQGVLLGLGVLISANSMLLILNTWFVERRGLAYGVYWGVGDLVAVGTSFLIDYLLHSLGQRGTFLILAGVVLVVPAPCLQLLRERGAGCVLERPKRKYTVGNTESKARIFERHTNPPPFYKHPVFYLLSTSSMLHALSFYPPQIYLSTYAILALQLPAIASPLLLAFSNVAAVIGQVSFGALSDHIAPHALIVVSCGTCSLITVTLWGCTPLVPTPAGQLAALTAFALVFGIAGAGMMSCWARIGVGFRQYRSSPRKGTNTPDSHVAPDDTDDTDQSQIVFGWLCAGRGLGCVVSGPLSKALLYGQAGLAVSKRKYGTGPGWRELCVYVSVMMAASACAAVACWLVDKRGNLICSEPAGSTLRDAACLASVDGQEQVLDGACGGDAQSQNQTRFSVPRKPLARGASNIWLGVLGPRSVHICSDPLFDADAMRRWGEVEGYPRRYGP